MKSSQAISLKKTSMDSALLAELAANAGTVISGEYLSSRLGISRTAVWKQVNSLRKNGVNISTVRSQGYLIPENEQMLVPSLLMEGLSPLRIPNEIICFNSMDSTNMEAVKRADNAAPEGLTVIADSQTAGKGRLGRRWESPAVVNLYCSVILRPEIPPQRASQLTFVSSLAVASAINKTTALKALLKWPNDVLINGKKCAGLLNEMSAESDRINYVILGTGVNINMKPADFPPDLRHPATSLCIESGADVDRVRFTRTFLQELDAIYDEYLEKGFEALKKRWMAQSCMAGKTVSVSIDHCTSFAGKAVDIDDIGALMVEISTGEIKRVLAGDVRILEGEA